MDLELLVATMNQSDNSLPEKMRIESNAIIGNQCDRNEIRYYKYNGYLIKSLSFQEKGVGLNRNNALMRSTGDICLVSDDDIVLKKGYRKTIIDSFKDNPEADVIIFNLDEVDNRRYVIKKKININYFNYMRFGAARIAFKREKITKYGISFNLNFGGGTRFSAGEDTLFINSCLKSKLKIIALPIFVGEISDERPSTWFEGYNKKFFVDRGALFYAVSKKWAYLLTIQFLIRRQKKFKDKNLLTAYKYMIEGINVFKKM